MMDASSPAIGHNSAPEDALVISLEAILDEASGAVVTNDDQMNVVDGFLAQVKDLEKSAKAAKEVEFRPAKEVCDAIAARFKPILSDCDKAKKTFTGLLNDYKVKRAEEIRVEKERLEREAEEKRLAAQDAENAVDMTDKDTRGVADVLGLEARDAQRAVQSVGNIKGLRTRSVVTITDPAEFWKWLQKNDFAFAMMQSEAERLHKEGRTDMAGVSIEKEQYAV